MCQISDHKISKINYTRSCDIMTNSDERIKNLFHSVILLSNINHLLEMINNQDGLMIKLLFDHKYLFHTK